MIFHRLGKEKADSILAIILGNLKVLDLSIGLIKEAAVFRSEQLPKKQFSYADSVNYVAARTLGIRLLTGDEEFKGMENVEFTK